MCLSDQCLTPSPAGVDAAVGDGGDAHEVVLRVLVTAQDLRPGVTVAAHDGGTAVPHRLTQTPAGRDKPDSHETVREPGRLPLDELCLSTNGLVKNIWQLVLIGF